MIRRLTKLHGPSPWKPDTSKLNLAMLGKFLEELNECGAITARCIIQGIKESEPVTKKGNKEALEDEIADVLACIILVMNHFNLDYSNISNREVAKLKHLKEWHEMIKRMKGENVTHKLVKRETRNQILSHKQTKRK